MYVSTCCSLLIMFPLVKLMLSCCLLKQGVAVIISVTKYPSTGLRGGGRGGGGGGGGGGKMGWAYQQPL